MKSASRTMVRPAQEVQRRKTIGMVYSPGCAMPARCGAAATACHDSRSGQYPVDWLLTSRTDRPDRVWANAISPADRYLVTRLRRAAITARSLTFA